MAPADDAACSLDDAGPFPLVRPASLDELRTTVVRAAQDHQAVYPLGGRTRLGVGAPPARPGIAVELTRLDQVLDYPARDMTITVQAGITLARLQEVLRAEKQRLPLDVPQPDRATLGGSLAVNVAGPRRLGFGTLRDYVIGISTVNDEGHETKAGGRVVKNVAGYDLCKLHVGALGTLGIISQVTLKLKPVPEETALVVCRCDEADLAGILDRLHQGRARPVCLDVLDPLAATALPGSAWGWAVVVGFEENAEAVRWQVQQVLRDLAGNHTLGIDALVGPPTAPVWQFLTEFPARPAATLTIRANLLPHAVADFCRSAKRLDAGLELQAHAGSGIVIGHAGTGVNLERARALVLALQETAIGARGNLTVPQCPSAWKAALPIWGRPRGDAALMKAVRDKMDPRKMFNPGRFLV